MRVATVSLHRRNTSPSPTQIPNRSHSPDPRSTTNPDMSRGFVFREKEKDNINSDAHEEEVNFTLPAMTSPSKGEKGEKSEKGEKGEKGEKEKKEKKKKNGFLQTFSRKKTEFVDTTRSSSTERSEKVIIARKRSKQNSFALYKKSPTQFLKEEEDYSLSSQSSCDQILSRTSSFTIERQDSEVSISTIGGDFADTFSSMLVYQKAETLELELYEKHQGLFDETDDPSEIQLHRSEDGSPQLIGATLERLVQQLTFEGTTVDPRYSQTFLLVHTAFTSSSELLELIILRFYPPLLEGEELEIFFKKRLRTRLRVINVLKIWVTKFFGDFSKDEKLLQKLVQFVDEKLGLTPPHESMAANLRASIEKQLRVRAEIQRKKDLELKERQRREIDDAIIPFNLMTKLCFMDLDISTTAQQMTKIDSKLFKLIEPQECLNGRWMKADKHSKSPNVIAMIDRFNYSGSWVASEILRIESPKQRAELVEKFVSLGKEFVRLNNYNGVVAVISGLGNSAVYRLKKTWSIVSKTAQESLKVLNQLCSSEQNFATIRKAMKSSLPPCVPHMGIFLKDLIFIEDGNPDYIKGTQMINFNKHKLTADVILTMMSYQHAEYDIKEIATYQEFLSNTSILTGDELYQASMTLEPRGS